MNSAQNVPPVIGQTPPRRKRRWWVYALIALGCMILLAVALVVGILGYLNSLVTKYTDTQPKALPKVEVTAATLEQLKNRWTTFSQSVMQGRFTRPFSMSPTELNQLVAGIPQVKDRLHMEINGDKLQADFTMPLDQTRQAKLKGRHLNGRATFDLKLEYGFLNLNVAKLEANGKPAPSWLLSKLKKENFLKFLDQNREFMDLLQRMESVQVLDGQLVFTPTDERSPQ